VTRTAPDDAGVLWVGVLEVVAAASLWGSSGVFSVSLFRMGVPPETLALFRPLFGAAGLLAWALVRRTTTDGDTGSDARPSGSPARLDGTALLVLLGLGGAVMAVFQIAYQLSTDAVGVPSTVALLYLAPALVVGAAGPLLGEWPTARRVALAGLVVGGVWLSVLGAQEVATEFGSRGVGWGVLAAAGYAGYTVFGRVATPRWGSRATVTWSTVGSVGILLVLVPWLFGGVPLPGTPAAWGLLAVYGILTVAVAQYLFFDALGRLEASRVSIAASSEPVVAALLATLLLGQGLEPLGWVGLAVVVVGVTGVAGTRPDDARVSAQR